MRVQTEEWRRFIPGVRMYKGKMTLFYNGEILIEYGEFVVYDKEERKSWEVIIVLPGVQVIPNGSFCNCYNVEAVILSDTVRRVEYRSFSICKKLVFVKLSRNLEYIGESALDDCQSLTSIFIPPSCREIDEDAFSNCEKLIIFSVPQHTTLGVNVIAKTALIRASPFDTDRYGRYSNHEEVNTWIKNRHRTDEDDEFSLHRACFSYSPSEEVIFDIVNRQGLKAFKKPDSVGVTPSQYLSENPFSEVKEQKIINITFLI